jgi:RNA polymerase sigma-70 factor, ECF subfamily
LLLKPAISASGARSKAVDQRDVAGRISDAGKHPIEDLRVLYDLHGDEIFRFCGRFLRDRSLAEEAVQETFLRAWRSPARQAGNVAQVRPWLFSIARTTCLDAQRRIRVRPLTSDAPAPDFPADDHSIDDVFATWTVEEALRRIRPDQRYAIVETYLKGRTYTELSAEISVPEATIRSRVFYGLKALRLALEEMGIHD